MTDESIREDIITTLKTALLLILFIISTGLSMIILDYFYEEILFTITEIYLVSMFSSIIMFLIMFALVGSFLSGEKTE